MESQTWLLQFHMAIKYGPIQEAKAILSSKPIGMSVDDIGPTCIQGNSALEYLTSKKADSARNKEMIKLVLQYGADPMKISEGNDKCPAHLAFLHHDDEVIKNILDHIEDLNQPIETAKKRNALHLSVAEENLEILEYCIGRKVNVNEPSAHGQTALFMAVRARKKPTEMMKILLKSGAVVNQRDYIGFNPIHMDLLINHRLEVLNLLLAYNADVNAVCILRKTPLHLILERYPNVNLVKKIIRHGASAAFPGPNGGNSLHVFMNSNPHHQNPSKITDILIDNGACVDQKDNNGNTPLHHAIMNESHKFVEHLAFRGADFSVKNDLGHLPMYYIKGNETNTKLLSVIVRHVTMQAHSRDLEIPEEYNDIIESSKKMKAMKKKCEAEIKSMRKKEISPTDVSYLKLFNSRDGAVAKFMRKSSSRAELQKFRPKMFTNYGKQLKGKINRALCRRQLEDYAFDFLSRAFEHRVSLLCLEELVNHLSEQELCKIRTCLSIANSESSGLLLRSYNLKPY